MSGRDDDRAVRYLLDELPAEERDVFEDQYFDDAEAHAALLAAEDELIDRYCEGTLPADQRQRFEERYLATPEGRERVAFASALVRYAAAHRAAPAAPSRAPVRHALRLGLAWAAAILLAATAVVALLGAQRETRRARAAQAMLQERLQAQQEQARREEQRAAATASELARLRDEAAALGDLLGLDPTQPVRAAALALASGLRRDAGGVPRLVIEPGIALVRLRLLLAGVPRAAYRAALQTAEGRELWARNGLSPTVVEGKAGVSLTLPAPLLAPGHYVVTLADPAERRRDETDAEFVFEVRRRAP